MLCMLTLLGALLAIVALAVALPCTDAERRRQEHIPLLPDEEVK